MVKDKSVGARQRKRCYWLVVLLVQQLVKSDDCVGGVWWWVRDELSQTCAQSELCMSAGSGGESGDSQASRLTLCRAAGSGLPSSCLSCHSITEVSSRM